MARVDRSVRAQAYVGLGSNLDDPISQVRAGMALLAKLPATYLDICSSLYRTAPVGMTAQPDFINALCRLQTQLDPAEMMTGLLALEAERGRVRDEPGGPRTLDLDLLLYFSPQGDMVQCQESDLTLPHPRLHERAFVLYPLQEIAPSLAIPGRGRVADLLASCGGQSVEKLASAKY